MQARYWSNQAQF